MTVVLVTGASGFIGRHLAPALARRMGSPTRRATAVREQRRGGNRVYQATD
jgi:uncharacterized protein YbjT (DUF2867 family)